MAVLPHGVPWPTLDVQPFDRTSLIRGARNVLPATYCLVNFALRLIAGVAVTLLDLPDQLVASARRLIQFVVRQPAPLFLRLPLSCLQLPSIWSQFIGNLLFLNGASGVPSSRFSSPTRFRRRYLWLRPVPAS